MLQGLKRLFFGQPAHHDAGLPYDEEMLGVTPLHELVQMNIELGRQIDALREKRKQVKARIDPLLIEIAARGGN